VGEYSDEIHTELLYSLTKNKIQQQQPKTINKFSS